VLRHRKLFQQIAILSGVLIITGNVLTALPPDKRFADSWINHVLLGPHVSKKGAASVVFPRSSTTKAGGLVPAD